MALGLVVGLGKMARRMGSVMAISGAERSIYIFTISNFIYIVSIKYCERGIATRKLTKN